MKTTKTKNLLLGIAIGIGTSFATVAQNVPNYVPTNGLVGWWPFNGNANDVSGNGNNGLIDGAILSNDRFGVANKSFYFDGINDGISVNSVLSNSPNSYTINFWCKLDTNNLPANGFTIFDDCDSLQWYGKGRFLVNSSFFPNSNFNFRETNNIAKDTIFINQWINFSCVFNLQVSKLYLYRNSILIDSANYQANSYVGGNRKMQFGRCQTPLMYNGINYYTSNWKGKIDDIGIWNRPLTQQEITDLYNANICYQTVTVTDTLIINTNTVSFNPITYQNTIKIFPNPTSDHITINYGNFATLNGYQLKIINSLGQQMFQTAINQQSSYINLSNWTGNGIYFVQIIDPQGNIIDIRKIVLQ